MEDALEWPRCPRCGQLGSLSNRPRRAPSKRAPWQAEPWLLGTAPRAGSEQLRRCPSSHCTYTSAGAHTTPPGPHPSHGLPVTCSQRSGPDGGCTCEDPALSQHAGQFCSCHSATAVLWEGAPEGPAESACSEMAVGAQRSKGPPGSWQNLPCHSHYVSKEMTGSHCSSQHGLDRSGCRGRPRVPLCSALTSSMLHLNSGGPARGQCQPQIGRAHV